MYPPHLAGSSTGTQYIVEYKGVTHYIAPAVQQNTQKHLFLQPGEAKWELPQESVSGHMAGCENRRVSSFYCIFGLK